MALQVLLQTLGLAEAFVTGATGKRFEVARHMFPQLVFLMEAFVTELTEEPLLLV